MISQLKIKCANTCVRDIIPAGKNLAETNGNLDEITNYILMLQSETGIIPLWATCNLFSHPRCIFMFSFSSVYLNISWLLKRSLVGVFSRFQFSICSFSCCISCYLSHCCFCLQIENVFLLIKVYVGVTFYCFNTVCLTNVFWSCLMHYICNHIYITRCAKYVQGCKICLSGQFIESVYLNAHILKLLGCFALLWHTFMPFYPKHILT